MEPMDNIDYVPDFNMRERWSTALTYQGPGLENWTGRWYNPIRIRIACSDLVRALRPSRAKKANVLWNVNPLGTDHSWQTPTTYEVRLNPIRAMKNGGHVLASCLGATMHEIAHLNYTPEGFGADIKTPLQRQVFSLYEELYVNGALLRHQLPRVRSAIWRAYASVWDEANMASGADMYDRLNVIGAAHIMAHLAPGANAPVPDVARPYEERLRPYAKRLIAEDIPWPERAAMYAEMAVIFDDSPPQQQSEGDDASSGDAGGQQSGVDDGNSGRSPVSKQREHRTMARQRDAKGIRLVPCALGDSDMLAQGSTTKETIVMEQANKATFVDDSTEPVRIKEPPFDRNMFAFADNDRELVDRLSDVLVARGNTRRRIIHRLPEGRISRRQLVPAQLGHSNVWQRRPVTKDVAAAFALLVDISGSMDHFAQGTGYHSRQEGSRYSSEMPATAYGVAGRAAATLAEALLTNPDYSVEDIAFESLNGIATIYPSEITDEGVSRATGDAGSTPITASIEAVHRLLLERHPQSRRVVFAITDFDFYPEPSEGQMRFFEELRASGNAHTIFVHIKTDTGTSADILQRKAMQIAGTDARFVDATTMAETLAEIFEEYA